MRRKVYIGSVGPFLYDDEDDINDPDEDEFGEDNKQCALVTNQQIVITEPPTKEGHVMRKDEFDDALGGGLDRSITVIRSAWIDGGGVLHLAYQHMEFVGGILVGATQS